MVRLHQVKERGFDYMQMKLYELRKENKLSQEDVSELLDVTKYTYSRIESGKTEISLNQAITLANHFKVDIKVLFNKEFSKLKVGE